MKNHVLPYSTLSTFDVDLFRSGTHYRLYEKFGALPCTRDGKKGCAFTVYAPAAKDVRVIGDFNYWNGEEHRLHVRWDGSGIWEGFIPGIGEGTLYKYLIFSDHGEGRYEKADPFARRAEHPPKTASVIWKRPFSWKDGPWMKKRAAKNALQAPFSVYEVHLASWKRNVEENKPLDWDTLSRELPPYVSSLGFTHVELMPIMEYPYDPSWGYQITGYFAPSARFGEPEGLKQLIDAFHREGIGIILDWVPSHFPSDKHGLALFDGTCVYEHPDPKKGYHPDWKSLIFNYGRPEVKSFLISNALYWLDEFHVDGLRVDAVASMLYLDYSRNAGEWEPNEYGGRENLDAIRFLKDLNTAVYQFYPDVQTIAEESTSFPGLTRPVHLGGLGFGMKWMMGWMNDTLRFFSKDPVHRRYHHNEISFSLAYAFSENFMLPLSHDEVVHGKKSLLSKMPGDRWQQFANLRSLLALMYLHPGTKLLFMGAEFGQPTEWRFNSSLDWHLSDEPGHAGIRALLSELNRMYASQKCLHFQQFAENGFEWIDFTDSDNSVIAFVRKSENTLPLVAVFNFTPIPREHYRIGIPDYKRWKELQNTDDSSYGGSGCINPGILAAEPQGWHGREKSISITLPPLGAVILTPAK